MAEQIDVQTLVKQLIAGSTPRGEQRVDLPGTGLLDWHGSVELTPTSPTATVYAAG